MKFVAILDLLKMTQEVLVDEDKKKIQKEVNRRIFALVLFGKQKLKDLDRTILERTRFKVVSLMF